MKIGAEPGFSWSRAWADWRPASLAVLTMPTAWCLALLFGRAKVYTKTARIPKKGDLPKELFALARGFIHWGALGQRESTAVNPGVGKVGLERSPSPGSGVSFPPPTAAAHNSSGLGQTGGTAGPVCSPRTCGLSARCRRQFCSTCKGNFHQYSTKISRGSRPQCRPGPPPLACGGRALTGIRHGSHQPRPVLSYTAVSTRWASATRPAPRSTPSALNASSLQ